MSGPAKKGGGIQGRIFLGLLLLSLTGACAHKALLPVLPAQWGPHPPVGAPALLDAKASSWDPARRLRAYASRRAAALEGGAVLGASLVSWDELEGWLKKAGAQEQAQGLHGLARAIKAVEKGHTIGQTVTFPLDVLVYLMIVSAGGNGAGGLNPGDGFSKGETSAYREALARLAQARGWVLSSYNRWLADKLNLEAAVTKSLLKPEDLHLQSLGPDEDPQEYAAFFLLSRDQGRWRQGPWPLNDEKIAEILGHSPQEMQSQLWLQEAERYNRALIPAAVKR